MDTDPCIFHKKSDLQFCLRFPQHQYNVTTRIVDKLSSSYRCIKTPERGNGSMAAITRGSSAIRTSVSSDIFDDKTDGVNKHKEASYDYVENNESSAVTLNPPHAGISKVDTITPKMSILFNQSAYIKFGYHGKFEFVDTQRAKDDNFCKYHMIVPTNPTKQEKTMTEK